MTRVWISHYELHPKTQLGSKGGIAPRQGALLRLESANGIGYADCHPWPELGDANLQSQLQSLKLAKPLPLISRSVMFAAWDAGARQAGASILRDLPLPKSHFLLPNALSIQIKTLEEAYHQGFRTIKTKMMPDLNACLKAFQKLEELSFFSELKWRLDFSAGIDLTQFLYFWRSLSARFREQIDFVEDPCFYSREAWHQLMSEKIPVGIDRPESASVDADFLQTLEANSFKVFIFKPAAQESELIADLKSRIVVTSYLDHPVGQVCAAAVAGRWIKKGKINKEEVCGLLSQGVYELNAFSDRFSEGPDFPSDLGAGVGFADLLDELNWQSLI